MALLAAVATAPTPAAAPASALPAIGAKAAAAAAAAAALSCSVTGRIRRTISLLPLPAAGPRTRASRSWMRSARARDTWGDRDGGGGEGGRER